MSVSTEVQRTLVKSPPELWSELSNPDALARHLAELGEVRITSVEPETKVEWESEGATGIVHLKQSGWGTKVTLSVTRVPPASSGTSGPTEEAEPEPVATVKPAPEPVVTVGPTPEPTAELEPSAVSTPEPLEESEPQSAVEAEHIPEPVAETTPEPAVEPEPQPEIRPGFFARLFRRRRTKPVEIANPEPESDFEPEPEPDFEALAAPELIFELTPKPAVDLAAELASMEAQMVEETTELLTGVLDRLGAAHHRPFSRG
ncbi:MAG: hypothetical protein WBQ21_05725 [Solirubrobacteraceae bacterium]